MSAERVLTQRHLNRALLARQLLLERGRMSLPKMLERVGGIQAQYAPSAYVGVWSRLEGFERDQLTRALERRTVVVGTLMRVTIHLVSAGDYWRFAGGVREARRQLLVRNRKEAGDARAMAAAAARVRGRMAGTTMTQAEVRELLGEAGGSVSVAFWLDLMRVPPSATWERRRADIYAAAEDWLGEEEVDPEDGIDHLVRSYLRGFGPAPTGDIASWAGLPVKDIARSIARLDLRRFRSEDEGELLDLPRALLPDPDTPAPVRFLPTWDANTLVHARRAQILPEQYRPRLFDTKNPRSLSTFLVDGSIAGAWRYEDGHVELEPFHRLDRATMRELGEEAERLAAFHE